MFKQLIAPIIAITLVACENKTEQGNINANPKDTLAAEPYYPVSSYIESQINYVDSTPLAIEMMTFVDNKLVDSGYIDRKTFKAVAKEFLKPDLNEAKYKPLYVESSFNDLTLNTITFSYKASDPTLELQAEDVLIDPENNKVKHVMFRKNRAIGDSSVSINGLWKHNMNFQLNYSIRVAGRQPQTKQVKVVWDKPRVEI